MQLRADDSVVYFEDCASQGQAVMDTLGESLTNVIFVHHSDVSKKHLRGGS